MEKLTLDAMLHSINNDSSVNRLVQSSPVCHKIFDPDLKLQFMSRSGVEALKIENIEEFYGHTFPTDVAPKSTREIFNETMHLATKGETNTIEYSFEVEGNVIWFKTTISPFFNTDGDLIYITADSMDITSIKKTENELLFQAKLLNTIKKAQSRFINKTNSNQLFDELLAETLDLTQSEFGFIGEILLTDQGKQYLQARTITNIACNKETQELYDLQYEIGLEFHNLDSLFGAVITTNKAVISNDPSKDSRSGSLPQGHPPLKSFLGLPFHQGEKLIGMVGMSNRPGGYDGEIIEFLQPFLVTCSNLIQALNNDRERQLAEKNWIIAKEEADKANQAKSEFLSRMSHELRTPLNAILGFSQLMKMNPNLDIEQRKSNVDHILDAGNHLLELVDDVLNLSKIETGKFSITEENLNASLMVEELIAQIHSFAEEKSIKILNRLSQQDDLFIRADRKAFNQIILNLLNNAVKYNNEAGLITVDGGAVGHDKIWISVSDTGPGIAKENIEKLFEPFNRLGQEFGGIEGTGIGLSISKILAELLGGSISAECDPGKGCCFKVVLPAGNRESVNISASDSDSDVAKTDVQSKSYKILYIEDNIDNLALVKQILETRPQINLFSAMHPRDGIDLARTHRPDLILMDMQLPDMDGIAAFRELQKFQETRDIPVIAITAQAMNDDIRKVLNSGFKDYLTKPIDVKIFLAKIDNILNP